MRTAIYMLLFMGSGAGGNIPPIGTFFMITEDGDRMITEDGDFMVTE